MTSPLDRRPVVVALAGPNGAGKSTFFDSHLARTGLRFVNADVLSLSLGMEPYAAAKKADAIRRKLVQLRESFIFETVFSDPVGEKVGYTVLLIFIGVSAPEISDGRVAMRVAQGGHDVPANKIVERYPRVMNNLKQALVEVAHVRVYDNSDLERPYRLVAVKEGEKKIELYDPVPEWLRSLLPAWLRPLLPKS